MRELRPGRTVRSVAAALVTLLLALVAVPASAAPQPFYVPIAPKQLTFSPGAGGVIGHYAVLWSRGAASAFATTWEETQPISLSFSLDAEQCEGAPRFEVAVDGVTMVSQEVLGRGGYRLRHDWAPGRHKVTFRFLNDHRTATCDRNVRLWDISFGDRAAGAPSYQNLKRQYVEVAPATRGNATPDGVMLRHDGTLRFRLDSFDAIHLSVRFKVTSCSAGAPNVVLAMDGETLFAQPAIRPTEDLYYVRHFNDGPHDFTLTMSNGLATATCVPSLALTDVFFDGDY